MSRETKKKANPSGSEAFFRYYETLFELRWPALLAALKADGSPVDYSDGLTAPYRLDNASVFAASCFTPLADGRWLDMCAAPGGKTLVMSKFLGKNASMVANERSHDRKRRLLSVLDSHLTHEMREKITVLGVDAAAMCRRERDSYDRILLDAPCSSERHVIASPKHLEAWTSARPKHLHHAQWALLSCAFLLLKPGGELVYATCALDPMENDGVVERLFSKYDGRVAVRPIGEFTGSETGKFGVSILPDVSDGAGPMYVSALTKIT